MGGRAVLLGLGTALQVTAFSNAVSAEIAGAEHRVQNDGIEIYAWEKVDGTPEGKPIVVLAHGSATAGRESFDLRVEGKSSYSLMDRLASEGFDVFALDTRGFGRSTHPEEHITTAQAKDDLGALIDFVLELRGASKVNLLGWSWGTQYGGMYVMENPDKVERYVSYAQMHVDSPDVAKRRARIGAFRENAYVSIPEEGWKPRFTSMTPAEVNEPEVVESYAREAAAVETRTATGPQLDLVTILPMVNPRLVTVPTMIIHGEYDDVADTDGLLPFFEQLANPQKQYVIIPEAGHMMHLQKGHDLFQHEVVSFFSAPMSGSE